MDVLRLLFLWVSLFCVVGLAIGLYKPWVVLWWEDVQNRKKVIQLYGSIAAVSYLISFLIEQLTTNN